MPTVIREFARAKAGEVSVIASGTFNSGELLTAVRNGSDNLELIVWNADAANRALTRGANSGTQAGEVGEIALAMMGSRCLTAVQNANGKLLVIPWALESDGTITRLEYADHQAGTASYLTISALTETLTITAVRNGSGNLLLIPWSLDAPTGQVSRLNSDSAQGGSVATGSHPRPNSPVPEGPLIASAAIDATNMITAKVNRAGGLEIAAWLVDTDFTVHGWAQSALDEVADFVYGVPAEWLSDVKNATEDTLLFLCDHLPAEAAEALLELATGGKPRAPQPVVAAVSPFDHPDAQRRFRVMTNMEELQRALDFPWEKWTVFLHPEQRQWVERDYTGPARVSGSAGTGKTIVALHRAAHLAHTHPDARVLLTTFSDTLASSLQTKLKRLLGNKPRLAERIDVYSLNAIGLRLYKAHIGPATIASREIVRELLDEAASTVSGHKFSVHFILTEWEQIVDAWQLDSWEGYRDVARLGRKTRLPEAQRVVLWSIFERVRAGLRDRKLITHAELFTTLAGTISANKNVVFDFAVVDEAQDISVAHLRFFAALGGGRPNALFFAGDLEQRIFQQPFSWKALGVDIRGRSRTLLMNYRTSHQIRSQADRLLGPVITDVDDNSEIRSDTVSVFNGPSPTIQTLKDERDEIKAVGHWIAERSEAGILPHEIGVFVRSSRNWSVPNPPSRSLTYLSKFLMNTLRLSAAMSRSVPCTRQGAGISCSGRDGLRRRSHSLAGTRRNGWR